MAIEVNRRYLTVIHRTATFKLFAIENPRPPMFALNQPGSNRILADIFGLSHNAFISAKPMIKKVSLPNNTGKFRDGAFEASDNHRQRGFTTDGNQGMEMIGHQQQYQQIPSLRLIINGRSSKDRIGNRFVTQLIPMPFTTANRDEIGCAKAPIRVRFVTQPFSNKGFRRWNGAHHLRDGD